MSNFLKFTEMKLRTILFATVAMTIVAVGCSKQEVTTPSKEYNVEFNVAGKGGFDAATKAVKTGWEAGDQIAIFCQPGGSGDYFMDNAKIIYLKYDGTSWTSSLVSDDLATELGASGKFTAIHYRLTAGDNICFGASGDAAMTFVTYKGGEILYYAGTYTETDGVISLGSIAMNFFPLTNRPAGQLFQVSVKGLSVADGWKMAVANNSYTPSSVAPTSTNQLSHNGTVAGYFNFNESNGYIGTWGKGLAEYRSCACVQNGEDISFVFIWKSDASLSDTNAKYHFYLTNGTDVYTYTVDRGEHNGSKYAKNLEIGHAYLLPAITEAGKWVKQQ